MMPYIHILEQLFSGTEVMGEVLEVGTKVQQLKPGDMVVGLQPIGGGFAEEMIAPEVVGIYLQSSCSHFYLLLVLLVYYVVQNV